MTTLAAGGIFRGFAHQELVLGGKPLVTVAATLLTGTAYKAGMVLGRITLGAVSSAAKSGGNTGNGTLVVDATNPKRAGAKAGIYAVRVVELHAVHDYTFEVRDPDGFSLGNFRLTGTGVSVTFDNDIKFALTDGATDFVVGDGFDVTIAAGTNKLRQSLAASEDGSQVPWAICPQDCDASAADKNLPVYTEGMFNEDALIYGTGHTADTVRLALRAMGIHIQSMRYSG